jgi:hypothetical protein
MFLMSAVLAGLAISLGCSRNVTTSALESDANGYACVNGHKFYTPRSLFADKCPQCGTIEITEVYGYFCDPKPPRAEDPKGCGHVTLAPRSGGGKGGGILCDKCKQPVTYVKLPSGSDLAAWGATKATKEQVQLK